MAVGLLLVALCFLGIRPAVAVDAAPADLFGGPGNSITLESKILDQTREILVALPRDYDTGDEHYPVLYVLDSDWHLLPAVAAVRMLAETSYIQAHRVPPLIVVGVRSVDRNHDATPTHCVSQHGMSFPTSGGADAFLDFFEQELIPEIDRRFRTHPYSILAGWSLGGLLTMHALLERPEIFGGYLAISPSLWWDDRILLARAQKLVDAGTPRERDLILTIGTAEEGGLCYEAVRELLGRWEREALEGLRWQLLEIEGEDHNHSPYVAYFEGVRALFADWFYPEEAFGQGLEALEAHYARLSTRWGFPNPIPDHMYNALARTYLSEGRGEDAIAVIASQCREKPESAMTHFQLGETCRKAGEIGRARAAYEQALELELGSSQPDSIFVNWLGNLLETMESDPSG
jgi:predicted alpha/beta superfamily hydrolase